MTSVSNEPGLDNRCYLKLSVKYLKPLRSETEYPGWHSETGVYIPTTGWETDAGRNETYINKEMF